MRNPVTFIAIGGFRRNKTQVYQTKKESMYKTKLDVLVGSFKIFPGCWLYKEVQYISNNICIDAYLLYVLYNVLFSQVKLTHYELDA